MTRHSPILRLPLLATLITLAMTGCGMDEYEKNMIEAQRRVDRFDEENRVLDSMVIIDEPMREIDIGGVKTPDSRPVAAVFFRPPRGIVPAVVDPSKVINERRKEFLYRYTVADGEKKLMMPKDENIVVSDVYLGFCTKFVGKDSQGQPRETKLPTEFADFDAFKQKVVGDSLFTSADIPMKPAETKKIVDVPGKEALTYSVWEGTQYLGKYAVRYLVYIYDAKEKGAVAVVYRILGTAESFKNNGPPGVVAPVIDMSLSSLLVGIEADSATQAWAKRGPIIAAPPPKPGAPAK